jgi:predicted nuclease of restriction endonuclease-like (RecB) superfamily
MTKDPYAFDFLMLAEDAKERELEHGLLNHLKNFFGAGCWIRIDRQPVPA